VRWLVVFSPVERSQLDHLGSELVVPKARIDHAQQIGKRDLREPGRAPGGVLGEAELLDFGEQFR
jgi:hypothetical protein